MKWISVKDRLPESPSWVLAYTAGGAMDCVAFREGEWHEWTRPQASGIVIEEITHWMLLPEPPEENEHE